MGHVSPIRGTTVARFRHLSADPEKVADFLRARHPLKTAEGVAADTGIGMAAARKLLQRGGAPSFSNFIRMVSAYGPAFLCAVMPAVPAWLDEAARRDERARIEAQIEALTRDLEVHP